jgi:L-malate glycosyltransferase
MKILFFSHQADFLYGGEICTLAFMGELRQLGHEVHFASPEGPYARRAAEVARCHVVSSVQFSRKLRRLPGFLHAWRNTRAELQKIVQQNGIELLHATSLKAMVYAAPLRKRLPVIWHHHDILPAGRANDLWVRQLAARAALVLAPSGATREALLLAGVPPAKVAVLHNGFQLENWKARGPRADSETLRVGLVGEISHRKGHDRLPGILEALKNRGERESAFEFLVVGEGLSDPAFAGEVRARLAGAAVRFLGRQEKMQEVYKQLDALLVPSRQDPLPTVIVEAGLSGLPIVAARAGGIPEMVQNGVNGYLFGNEAEAAEALVKVRKNWQQLAAASRDLAEKRYDIRALTQRLLGLYAGVRKKGTETPGAHGTAQG